MAESTSADARPSELGPRWAVVGDAVAARLQTTYEAVLELSVWETVHGPESITKHIAGVDTSNLGADGMAPPGTSVRPGDLLIGKIAPTGAPADPEDVLLRAVFGDDVSPVRDASLRAPSGLFGVVRDTRLGVPQETGELQRASITVGWSRALEVGDTLAVDGGARVTVCAIRSDSDEVCSARGRAACS